MTTKLIEESAREPFRPKSAVNAVARITKDTDKYSYAEVIHNYQHLPLNFDNYEKAGYEVVYSTEHIEDDRKFSPDNKQEDRLRPAPVLKRTKDGYEAVLMRIPKDVEKKFHKDQQVARDEKQRLQYRKVKANKSGTDVQIDDGEINFK